MSDHAEAKIYNNTTITDILGRVRVEGWLKQMDFYWEVEPIHGYSHRVDGWLVAATFMRPDSETGLLDRGRGRQEFIPWGATESRVVKTAWLCLELLLRHELLEAFHYKGVRIFDPHKDVQELAHPKVLFVNLDGEEEA